jgi:hypothetical protein
LTSKKPFKDTEDLDLGYVIPQTSSWIDIFALVDLKYSTDIINLMRNMLAYDPKDRYSGEEAFAAWEKIEEK